MKGNLTVVLCIIIGLISCHTKPASETTSLSLGNQKLRTIPDSVCTLTKLEYLSFGNSFVMYPPLAAISSNGHTDNDSLNRIQEIPDAIGNLENLKALDISANDIRSLPETLTKLKKLERLELCFNPHFNAKHEYRILSKMSWLKTLNIAATQEAPSNAGMLQQALPDTKIIATIEEMTVPLPEDKTVATWVNSS